MFKGVGGGKTSCIMSAFLDNVFLKYVFQMIVSMYVSWPDKLLLMAVFTLDSALKQSCVRC